MKKDYSTWLVQNEYFFSYLYLFMYLCSFWGIYVFFVILRFHVDVELKNVESIKNTQVNKI